MSTDCLYHLHKILHPCVDEFVRYRDATSSFAALAAQTAALSNSQSALYDRDHPSMAMQRRDGLPFCEVNEEALDRLRTKLGLQEWIINSKAGDIRTG